MAAAASADSDLPCTVSLPSGGMELQQEEQQESRLPTECRTETNTQNPTKSDVSGQATGLRVLQELRALSKIEKEAGQCQQGAPVCAAISEMKEGADQGQQGASQGAAPALVEANADALVAAGEMHGKEETQEDEQHSSSAGGKGVSHGREQVLLWSVRRGLTPIAAAAVDGCSRGEGVLETPSSAAAAPVTKEAATLEDETPRTSAPSSEVSPTNNFCTYKSFAAAYASSANAASTSASLTAPLTSRITGAVDTDDSDYCSFLVGALQSTEEISTAAAATDAVSTGVVPAAIVDTMKCSVKSTEAAQIAAEDPCGENAAAKVTPDRSADAAEASVSASSSAAAAVSEMLTTTTSADAAAILSSPAALSLLATPCPVGGTAAGAVVCNTGREAAAEPGAAAQGIAIEKGLDDVVVDAGGITRAEDGAVGATAIVDAAMGENADTGAAAGNGKSASLRQFEKTGAQGTLLKSEPQELLKTITACQLHEGKPQGSKEEGSTNVADHGLAAVDSFPPEKGDWRASSAELGDAAHSKLTTVKTGSAAARETEADAAAEDGTARAAQTDATASVGPAAASGGSDVDAAGNSPPREKVLGNRERCGSSVRLWGCRSEPTAEDEVAAAAASTPQVPAPLKMPSQEKDEQQKHRGLAKEDPSDGLKDVSSRLAPLSATSCSPELPDSPFAAFKGDISPVSCCSSSSTASVTSPTSSPLSSASCGALPCAAGATATAAPAAANEAAVTSETAAGAETIGTVESQPRSSADGDDGKGGGVNSENSHDVKSASSASSSGGARDNNIPTWYVGFRLPLGAEGRQVLLRRLRRAYHAAPPTTRDAVLASHGLYFSRVPFATVSDLFKLSHLLGVFDFAVQCSHEFGGSGSSGGSVTAGGGGGGSGKKNHNHQSRSANRSNSSSQRQCCGAGTGTVGEERKAVGSSAEAVGGSAPAASLAPHLGAAAGPNQRKNTGAAARRAGGAAAGNGGGGRKGGNGKVADQMSSAEANSTARGANKERGAAATAGLVEGVEARGAAGARDGATRGGDGSTKSEEEEVQATLKGATTARSRPPQQKRSAAGRSSACRPAARQQQSEQQQQHNILEELETLRRVEAAVGRCGAGDRSVSSRSSDWQAQQHVLQQLLQVGIAEEQASAADAGGADGKSTLEAEALALLSGEFGKEAAAAAASALLPSAAEGCNATKETQQRQQLDEQLLLLQLQEHAKRSAATCSRGNSRTADSPFDGRDLRAEQEQQQEQQALQCFLSEALQGKTRGLQLQQQQQQTLAGGRNNVNAARGGTPRSCWPASVLLPQEQPQWCSRPASAGAAGEENSWEKQPQEGAVKSQVPPSAELLPFLASAAEQLRNSSCVPSVGAAAARPSYRGSRKSDGKVLVGAELNDRSGGSSGGTDSNSSFDWNGFLMENYLNTVREQQQQVPTDYLLFSAAGSSTSASARPNLMRAALPAAAVAPRVHPQSTPRLHEEELLRLTKRPRTATPSRSPAAALSVATALSGREAPTTGAPPGVCAALLGRDGLSQAHTQEEAMRAALLAAGGSSLREQQQQQQQRRWTLNTVDEITRLLLQLNNGSSSSGTEKESNGGEVGRRGASHVHVKDSAQYDGGCKHSSSSSDAPCSRVPVNSTYGNSSISSGGCTSKGGCSPGLRTNSRCHPPFSVDVSSTENTCIPASVAGTTASGAAYDSPFHSDRKNVPVHESQDSLTMPSLPHGSSASATEQLQLQQDSARRPLSSSRGLSGGRSTCSNLGDAAALGGCNKNRPQVDSSNNRDGHTDVFLQLTSQLQLLSAQVLQQQESHSTQQHASQENPANERQYQHHVQVQQVYGDLQKGVNGPPMQATTAAAQEETAAAFPGRLCSAEKASEYAAGVQLLQLVELLQVQHRVSRLLSLFPKAAASSSPPSTLAGPMAAVSPSPSTPNVAAPTTAGLPAAAAAFSSVDGAGVAPTDAAATVEPSASLLAALASTILDGKANAALMNNSWQGTETPASVLLDLASGKTDVASLLKGGDNSEPLQQLVDVCNAQQQQQQQQALPPPNRGTSCRGNSSKSSNSKRAANRNSNGKGSGTKTSNSKCSNQGGERKSVSAGTEAVHHRAAAAAASGPVSAGREKSVSEHNAAPPKQQEAVVSNCVSHSNSFSTCCSDDVADLCSSGGSSSGTRSSPSSTGNLYDGACSAHPTYERAYTHESYSCTETRENMMDICMR